MPAAVKERTEMKKTLQLPDGLRLPGLFFYRYFTEASHGEDFFDFVAYLLSAPARLPQMGSHTYVLVPGHCWNSDRYGPERSDVMVVGKMLGIEEQNQLRHFVGPSGMLLHDTFLQLGVPAEELEKWYLTNALKTACLTLEPDQQWKEQWVKEQLFLLDFEIMMVRPRIILCVGVEALKCLTDRKAKLKDSHGQIYWRTVPAWQENPEYQAMVVCTTHPAQVLRYPAETYDQFLNDLQFFTQQLKSGTVAPEDHAQWAVVRSERELKDQIDRILRIIKSRPPKDRILGVDCEWQGLSFESSSYLRTVQFSWDNGQALVVELYDDQGRPCFQFDGNPDLRRVGQHLDRLFRECRLAGAFFVQDLDWLYRKLGMPVMDYWKAASSWEKVEEEGALDIALLAHAIDENDEFELKMQVFRHTSMPKYDVELRRFLEENPATKDGFGHVPDSILIPYAAKDAIATYRLAIHHLKNIRRDAWGNDCRKPFWIAQRASRAALDMRINGVHLDLERYDYIARICREMQQKYLDTIRDFFVWPDLNLDSTQQVAEALFGRLFNNSKDRRRLRPAGAKSLRLWPVFTTGKQAQPFMEAYAEWMMNRSRYPDQPCPNASVSEAVLKVLKYKQQIPCRVPGHPTFPAQPWVDWLIGYRKISQLRKTIFAERDPATGKYSAGLASWMSDAGTIHTTFYQTKETGRWSSAHPPLQNLPGDKVEPEYKAIFQDRYIYPIRSILRAPPGELLVDVDYTGAELVAMAIASGDPQLRSDVRRNQLPEDHPDYVDIHSSIACLAFGFKCPPTKAGLKSIGKLHMRVVAKSVIFGLFYGRGAKAIALAAEEEGIVITPEDAQRLIDTIYRKYPMMRQFQESCRARVSAAEGRNPPLYLTTAFGRHRRFRVLSVTDSEVQGEIERQALNFPIQGMIADVMNLALGHLIEYREATQAPYRLLLQVHDAILLSAPPEYIPRLIREVLPECLIRRIPIYRTDLDGKPVEDEPYYLSYSYSIGEHWEETLSEEQARKYQIDVPVSGQGAFVSSDR